MREYERRDAAATAEMQRIAQAVTWRNERLLALLALRGVSQVEIDAFLQQQQQQQETGDLIPNAGIFAPDANSEVSCTTPGDARSDGTSLLRLDLGSSAPEPSSNGNHVSICSKTTIPTAESHVMESNRIQDNDVSSDKAHSTSSDELPDLARNEGDVKQFCDPGDAATSSTEDGASTSCDAAANIIAGLHGHDDATQARGLLGCKDSSSCHVKNTRLFQLMVETT